MKPNVQRSFRLFRKRKKLNDLKKENIDDILEKKLEEYYNNIDTEAPSSFENAIQTAFSSKHNKKFLLMIAKKQKIFEKLKHFKKSISKYFIKVSQLAIILFCTLCVTYFVRATSFVDYLADFFNLNDININNSGIEQALENGNLQNVHMDYVRQNGIGVKISYALMNDLNLYLVFDIETDFSLKERDVDSLNIENLVITNEKDEIIYHKDVNNNFKGNKSIIQDEHHMKNLIFMMSDEIPESNKLNINFNNILFYKDENIGLEGSDINKNNIELKFEYILDLDITEEGKNISYDIVTKKSEESSIKIQKAIFDETGLNLLVESNTSDIKTKVNSFFNKGKTNSYLIKWFDNLKKEFIINISGIKENDKINLKIESGDKVNEYELIKNR